MENLDSRAEPSSSGKMMKYGMWACCAIMLAPVLLYVAAGGLSGGLASSAFIFAPLALCLGAHVVMHRFMGNSCHSDVENDGSDPAKSQATIGRPIASD